MFIIYSQGRFMKKKLSLLALTILTILTLVGCKENTEKLTVEKESFNHKNFSIELYYPKSSNIEVKGDVINRKEIVNTEQNYSIFIYLGEDTSYEVTKANVSLYSDYREFTIGKDDFEAFSFCTHNTQVVTILLEKSENVYRYVEISIEANDYTIDYQSGSELYNENKEIASIINSIVYNSEID